jgi:Metal-dependent hydrolase
MFELDKNIRIFTYNLGNAVYGEKFCFDGKRTDINYRNLFPSNRKEVLTNIDGQIEIIDNTDPDIILFQEISKLSFINYFSNPYRNCKQRLSDYSSSYLSNYNFLGILNHGKSIFVKENFDYEFLKAPYKIEGVLKNYFGSNKHYILSRIKINDSDKELIVINVHFTAFRKNYEIRIKQINYILDIAFKEYEKGNYVIVGGDFNMNLVTNTKVHKKSNLPKEILNKLSSNWNINCDGKTVRDLSVRLEENNDERVYDGFICSDNIEVIKINSLENFRYSDHSPVIMEFKLKKDKNM